MYDRYPTSTPDGRPYKFLFICGHMRSGTNWMCNLVRTHHDTVVYGEGPFGNILASLAEVKRTPWLYTCQMREMHSVLDAAFADFVRHCMLYLATLVPAKSWIVDSTSRQLWPYVPDAHHLHIRRDGRDVLVSWTFHQLNLGMPIGEPWASRMRHLAVAMKEDPEYFSKNPHLLLSDEEWVRSVMTGWRDFMLTAESVKARLARGDMSFPLLDLAYEDVIADATGAQRKIMAFLELDASEALPLSEKHRTAAGFESKDPTSHFRSGKVRDWEQYATPAFKRIVKEEAGEMLIQLGYEQANNW